MVIQGWSLIPRVIYNVTQALSRAVCAAPVGRAALSIQRYYLRLNMDGRTHPKICHSIHGSDVVCLSSIVLPFSSLYILPFLSTVRHLTWFKDIDIH